MAYALEDEFGDIIQKARIGQNINLSQLSRDTSIPQTELSKMEEYILKPTEEQVQEIAAALNLNFPKLLDIAMKRWTPAKWNANFDSKIEVVPLSMSVGRDYSAYSYLLTCKETIELSFIKRKFDQRKQKVEKNIYENNESAVVDTGVDSDKIIAALNERDLKPNSILITHGHSDHTGGLRKLQNVTQAQVYACKMEALSAEVREYIELDDEDTVELGNLNIKMFHTPGHTIGSCCYHVSKALFAGDTVFAGSLGRGNYSYTSLLESVRNKLFSLDDDVHIFPGHGPVTTIGQEKEHNPFF